MSDGDKPRSSEDLIRQAKERLTEPDEVGLEPVHKPETPVTEEPTDLLHEPPTSPRYALQPERERAQSEPNETNWEPSQVEAPRGDPWYTKKWVRVVGGLALLFGFQVWQVLSEQGPPRDDSGHITEAGTIGIFSVRAGDCLLVPDDPAAVITTVEAVPCNEPHDFEAYWWLTHDGGPNADYPSELELNIWADQGCFEAFAGYVGASYPRVLDLEYYYVTPIKEAWDDGERRALCSLGAVVPGEKLTGSVYQSGTAHEVITIGSKSVLDIAVGDCIGWSESEEISEVPLQSCNGLHDAEVFALPAMEYGALVPFPGDDIVSSWSETACGVEFDRLANRSQLDPTIHTYWMLWPTPESWTDGDRNVVCMVATSSGKMMTGQLSGG